MTITIAEIIALLIGLLEPIVSTWIKDWLNNLFSNSGRLLYHTLDAKDETVSGATQVVQKSLDETMWFHPFRRLFLRSILHHIVPRLADKASIDTASKAELIALA